jgi:hypothetical protein
MLAVASPIDIFQQSTIELRSCSRISGVRSSGPPNLSACICTYQYRKVGRTLSVSGSNRICTRAAGATLPRLGEPHRPKTHNRTWFACSRSAHEFVFSNNPAAIGGISSAQVGGLDHWPRSGSSNGIRRQRSPHTHMAVRERTRDNLRIYRAPKTQSRTRAHASARRHCQ